MTQDDSPDGAYRLPYDVAPRRYVLHLSPDLAAATFSGEETIELEVLAPTRRVVLHADGLAIADARIAEEAGAEPGVPCDLEADAAAQRVTFVAPAVLAPGRYRLSCRFSGVLNDRLEGFYRSTYVDEDGNERVIATTQFEETKARKAFPCFDEPDRKAVFSVTLDEPPGMLAVSNGPEVASEPLPGGGRRVRFKDTIPMSTYLVAFVVGPLVATEPVDAAGVALRVVHRPGREHLCATALDVARHALGFFTDYFAQPYPGDKLDLVALPDFAAGAMENLGCVTFREAILLADPANTSQVELERLAEVVEHEIAHMWFGDLVTMRWWNGIWLNEAFATFMALLCQDDYRPQWRCFTSFARAKAEALGVDGLHSTRPIEYPVRHPDEAAAMFDVLTYEKGAAVLWMVERFLGGTAFRDGVRRYLAAHRLSNAETGDLWDAIEAEAGDVPIRALMESWILQGGYPLVSARAAIGEGGQEAVELAQRPFAYLPAGEAPEGESAIGRDWLVPVIATGPSGERRTVLGPQGARLEGVAAPVVVNAGGSGFYRVAYDADLRSALLSEIEGLEALERYTIVSDAWATVLARLAELEEFLDVVERLGNEQDPHVWSVVLGALRTLDVVARPADRPALAAYTRRLLGPRLERLTWERAADEDEQTPVLRASLIGALGTIGEDGLVVARAREAFAADQSGARPYDADLAAAILSVVAAHADEAAFSAIVARYRAPRDPIDEQRHLMSLGSLRDPALAAAVHEMALREIRSQNAPYLLGAMLANRHVGPATYEFVTARFDELAARFPENSIHRMLEGITGLAGEGAPDFDAVRAFVEGHVAGGRRRLVTQSLERLAVHRRLGLALGERLGEVLAKRG
ncbi:MAG TPA: M1 family metallopeptidase [Acidimicrobiales bacterium]|nr:M1 family metallopeptidase [Acidimicrobiales bacterium]